MSATTWQRTVNLAAGDVIVTPAGPALIDRVETLDVSVVAWCAQTVLVTFADGTSTPYPAGSFTVQLQVGPRLSLVA